MIQKITFILACLFLFACSEHKKADIPANILSKQKMAEVMLDVHLLESAMNLNTYNTNGTTTQNSSPVFDVFAKHKVTKKQYNQSFQYYTQHPDLLTAIYQLVLDNLSKLQAQVMNRKEVVKFKPDTTHINKNNIPSNKNKKDKKFKMLKKN